MKIALLALGLLVSSLQVQASDTFACKEAVLEKVKEMSKDAYGYQAEFQPSIYRIMPEYDGHYVIVEMKNSAGEQLGGTYYVETLLLKDNSCKVSAKEDYK